YAFEALNMNKVWLGVNIENKRAYESYLKCGFKPEGILRQELYRNNTFYDVARMSLLKDEYLKIKKEWSVYEWIKKNYSA
ncbi:MAG: GNAT family N-acetyltransferase, partial [Pseudobdellovibrio sp.]